MKLKLMTLAFESGKGFVDEAVQAFLTDKEMVDVQHYFFVHEKQPWLTLLISYREQESEVKRTPGLHGDIYRQLDETEKVVFNALREWRTARSKQEGIPPYLIASNKQLARMVRGKAASRADLHRVEGIGEAKVERYGAEILDILAAHFQPAPGPAAGAPAGEDQS